MLKLALLVLLLSVLLSRRRPARGQTEVVDDGTRIDRDGAVREMVQDPVCGVFTAKASALSTVARGRVHYFCSGACYRRFLSEPDAEIAKSA